ncbi:Ig-like domain-containing protein [Haliscomenobacter hydrossis]|uniref:T9SS type A sorting domain-containing protein n=1 Tax=Haliscomenobacter hydrossis TaxID=2350 RepID=UPI00145C5F45|nr:Ig-like domain-containing protein [Haliscomenobacter hydrossis]
MKDTPSKVIFEGVMSTGVFVQPKHGKAYLDPSMTVNGSSNTRIYTLVYEPQAGYIGLDTFVYAVRTCITGNSCFKEVTVAVTVKLSKVDAYPDLYYVPSSATPVKLNVLTNDISNLGGLEIVSVSTINNGTAKITKGDPNIEFQAKAGFSGTAKLIYTVCDKVGSCDQTSVSIFVDRNDRSKPDTVKIFTLKNESAPILIPVVYGLVEQPQSGFFNGDLDVPVYTPNPGFKGSDYLTFEDGNAKIVAQIEVLDHVRNKFAVDDRADVLPGKNVEVDVLQNDGFVYGAGCIDYSQPKYGQVSYDSRNKGIFTYKAPTGFIGVDQFTYRSFPPGCGGVAEVATVYVYVSNYEPAYAKFLMSTAKSTPLVIAYNVPIETYSFNIVAQAKQGKVVFYPGLVNQVISGRLLQGSNLLVYIPNLGYTGPDAFEVTLCMADSKDCKNRKSIKVEVDVLDVGHPVLPSCIEDCVWAGDTNQDGIVDMNDLLPLGLHMGEVGVPRGEVSLEEWYGQHSSNWDNPYVTNYDLKHLDTDGDSLIMDRDTLAISKFYGNTHSFVPTPIPFYNYEIKIVSDQELEPGKPFEFDLVIGDQKSPVIDLYGFTFALPYNAKLFKPQSFSIALSDDSWLGYNSPVLAMTRDDQKGLLEMAFTRTNKLAVSGYGRIGKGKGVVIDAIEGLEVPDADEEQETIIKFPGGTGTGVSSSGQTFGIRVAPFEFKFKKSNKPSTPNLGRPLEQKLPSVRLFPNPASNMVRLDLGKNDASIQRLQVFNALGQMVYNTLGDGNPYAEIGVSHWSEGMYVAKVFTNKGVYSEKFEVFK